MNTYAWMRATASSRAESRVRMINVMEAMAGLIDMRASVAPPIK